MATQTRDIKRRIKSVQSTQQITRAMKMVAAAKLRKAQERMLAMRPYCRELEELLAAVVSHSIGDEHPLLIGRGEPQRAALVVMTSDRGLCGSFNNSILRAADAFVDEHRGIDVKLFAVGNKAQKGLSRGRAPGKVENISGVWDNLSFVTASALSASLCARFEAEEIDEAHVLYAEFRTAVTQTLRVRRILPVSRAEISVATADGHAITEAAHAGITSPGVEFDPDMATVAGSLFRQFVGAEVYRAMLENQASEFGARMTAMDTATNNADDMLAALTLEYNKARQADITTEILDIVGGAEALRAE